MRAFGAAQGPLQPVRPVQALLLALMATAVVCYPAWPGYTSYDSFRAFDEARGGVTSAIWPPMHAYLFRVSLWLRQGLGGLFAVQTFVLFAGAFLTIQALTARAGQGVLLCLGFLATFLWIPPQLGVLVTHWRDVTMTSFALLALGVWAASARRRFEPGDRLTVLWASADRDADVFGDPDEFRLGRPAPDNLLYGAGIHVCPGAPLARLELQVLVEELLAATSRIEPWPDEPPVRAAFPAGGFTDLSVRLTAAPAPPPGTVPAATPRGAHDE